MAKPRTKPPVSDEPITQRIHVGGLAASVTPKELVARFSSFGQIINGVQGVSGLGTSLSGLPINYAFFSLETTQSQLNRCISMLNGSMWKSHKLRIQLAKPDWQSRREEERKQQAISSDPSLASTLASSSNEKKPKSKKRKLSSDPNVGYTAKRFEVVTPSNIENHKGWILDAKPYSSTPLFPLVVRPSHPIYLPPKAATTSWTRGKSLNVDQKKEKKEDENERERREVKRIKRIRIDPRRYGRRKIVYPLENEGVGGLISVGHWECEDQEEEEGKEEVSWVFKGRDGEVRHREIVKLNQSQREHTDQFKALLEKLQLPQCSAKPEANQEANGMEEELDKILIEPTMTSAKARSLSPPPYVPSAQRQLLYNEEDAFQLLSTTLDEETRLAEVEKERKRLVRLAMGIVEEPVEVKEDQVESSSSSKGRMLPKVEGFAEESDDDDEVFTSQVLRIRGGAGGVPEDRDSDSSSDESEGEEDEKMKEEKEKPAKTTLVRESLKDMFKPQEEQAASFSLFSGLDLDLSEGDVERSPSPEAFAIPIPSALPPPLPKILPIYRNQRQLPQDQQDKGPSYSFFGLLGVQGEELEAKRKVENEKRLRESGVDGWWKNQTQEEIDEAHSKLRENLRGFSRKRHRESVKRTKKKGSGAGNRRREGGLGGFTLDSTLAEE